VTPEPVAPEPAAPIPVAQEVAAPEPVASDEAVQAPVAPESVPEETAPREAAPEQRPVPEPSRRQAPDRLGRTISDRPFPERYPYQSGAVEKASSVSERPSHARADERQVSRPPSRSYQEKTQVDRPERQYADRRALERQDRQDRQQDRHQDRSYDERQQYQRVMPDTPRYRSSEQADHFRSGAEQRQVDERDYRQTARQQEPPADVVYVRPTKTARPRPDSGPTMKELANMTLVDLQRVARDWVLPGIRPSARRSWSSRS
jgi:hypothetical protein